LGIYRGLGAGQPPEKGAMQMVIVGGRRLTVVLVLSSEFAEATIDIILHGRRARGGHVICSIRIIQLDIQFRG